MKLANRFFALAAGAVLAIAISAACPATADDECQGQAEPATKPTCCPATTEAPTEAPTEVQGESAGATPACPVAQLAKTWGIEIVSLRLSAQGYFVDFRYRVLDADKAGPLAKHDWKPYLIDQATGKKLLVPSTPKLGPLRQTAQKLTAGRIYYIFFGNSRGIVKAGSKVTVVIGDCRIENLTLE